MKFEQYKIILMQPVFIGHSSEKLEGDSHIFLQVL